jgi:hypothetical protein
VSDFLPFFPKFSSWRTETEKMREDKKERGGEIVILTFNNGAWRIGETDKRAKST